MRLEHICLSLDKFIVHPVSVTTDSSTDNERTKTVTIQNDSSREKTQDMDTTANKNN